MLIITRSGRTFLEVFVFEAEVAHDAGAVVLDHYVGDGYEAGAGDPGPRSV